MSLKTVKMSDAVRGILSTSEVAEAGGATGVFVLKLPPGQLERKLYTEVNAVLIALGGKWDRRSQGHVFAGDPRARLETGCKEAEVVDVKKTANQFFSPPLLAKELAELAAGALGRPDLTGLDVLEPSAGGGALVQAALDAGASAVVAVESDPELVARLRAWSAQIQLHRVKVEEADFLVYAKQHSQPVYDAVVMNPPWSGGRDAIHVTAAWPLVKPGGVLVAAVSGTAIRKTTKRYEEFRDLHYTFGAAYDIPAGTFKASGTGVGGTIVVWKKPA